MVLDLIGDCDCVVVDDDSGVLCHWGQGICEKAYLKIGVTGEILRFNKFHKMQQPLCGRKKPLNLISWVGSGIQCWA